MRRVVEMVAAAALVLALCSVAAKATGLPPRGAPSDLGSELMLRLFGETSDAGASFAASQGDRTSESPFRELALAIHTTTSAPGFTSGIGTTFAQDRLALRDLYAARSEVRFSPSQSATGDVIALSPSALFAAPYQPVAPAPNISPAPGTLAFAPVTVSAGSGDSLAAGTRVAFAPATSQIGSVRFETHSDAATPVTPRLDLPNSSYAAGANFDVRAGKRNVSFNLSSEYDQVASGGANRFSASTLGSSAWQLPGSAPLVLPNDAGLDRLSFGAGVAVPVVRGLTLNLNYAAQRLYNGYALPGLLNLDTANNTYGGGLTFHIPDTSSSLSVSAYQDRIQDSVLPINGSTQTREDVNFTVKF